MTVQQFMKSLERQYKTFVIIGTSWEYFWGVVGSKIPGQVYSFAATTTALLYIETRLPQILLAAKEGDGKLAVLFLQTPKNEMQEARFLMVQDCGFPIYDMNAWRE